MKILGREIIINKLPKEGVIKNDYADSVAGRLTAMGYKVSVNGRRTDGSTYTSNEIEEINRDYVFGAIRKIRTKVADILVNNIEVYDAKVGNPKTSPMLENVKHPYQIAIENDDMDDSLFWQGIATFIILNGEAFIFAGERTMEAGNIKPTKSFELLQSNKVIRTYDDEGRLLSYKEMRKKPGLGGIEEPIYYVPTNILPIIDFNPSEIRRGYGMIRPIIESVSLENMTKRLQVATLANAIKAPGILSTKQRVPADDFDDLKNDVNSKYTSNDMDKAGVPIVTNGGFLQYESLLEDLDKLAMKKIRDLNRDSFIAALGASKTILGIEEAGTTRDVARVQTENFILDSCMPIADAIINGFNQDYINTYPKEYQAKSLRMRAIAPIAKDSEQEKAEAETQKVKAETFKVLIDAGMDPRQAGEVAGIDLSDGEEIIVIPRNHVTSIELTDEQINKIKQNKIENEKEHDHDHDNEFNFHDHVHGMCDCRSDENIVKLQINNLTEKEKKRITKAETDLTKKVRELDGRLGDLYVKGVNQASDEERENYMAELAAALLAYYVVSALTFGPYRAKQLASDFGHKTTPFVMSESIKEEIKERLIKVANEHFHTIDEELNKIIARGVRDELPRAEIVRLVKSKVDTDVKTWQVERLVATETRNAYQFSNFIAEKQFLVENNYIGRAYKVWVTQGPAPCEFCRSMAGTRVPHEENFLNVGDTVEATTMTSDGKIKQSFFPVRFVDITTGGLHPNCFCSYKLVIE